MARFTITLPDERHERLRYRAARENKSIGQVIEDELRAADEARRATLAALIEKGRANAEKAPSMTDDELMDLGMRLAHEVREEMAAEREQ